MRFDLTVCALVMITLSDLQGGNGLIGLSAKDIQRYSLTRVIRSRVEHKPLEGLEAEVDQEMSRHRICSHRIEGCGIPFDLFVPPRRTRDGSMNTGTFGAGGALVETQVSSSVIPLLRNKISAVRLGATVIDGLSANFEIPRQTSASSPQSLSETGQTLVSTPTFNQLSLSPKRISAAVQYSRQLIFQSSVALESWLRQDIFDQMAIKLDSLLLNGQGAASELLGILNTPGVGSILFGGTPTWQQIVSFENALAAQNADVPGARIAWVTSPNVRNRWKAIAKTGVGVTSVVPIFLWDNDGFNDDTGDGKVNGYRAAVTNQVSATNQVIFGNWQELILGVFGSAIDLLVNHWSLDTTGQIRITANMFADAGIRHPQSFCASADAGNQ